MGNPRPLIVYFRLFKQSLQFLQTNKREKMSNQYIYSAGIWTHDLQNMSSLPKPLDQGSRPQMVCFILNCANWMKVHQKQIWSRWPTEWKFTKTNLVTLVNLLIKKKNKEYVYLSMFLKFPCLFFCIFVFSIQLSVIKVWQWLDSNRGLLTLEATALPTEPQPLPPWACLNNSLLYKFLFEKQIKGRLVFYLIR